jgi:UDP-N-acetylmuramate dehydrogenase
VLHLNLLRESAQHLRQTFGRERIRDKVPLAPYTTFKIGGPADLFFEARSADELVEVLILAGEFGLPVFRLGAGANILVGDLGFRGLVVHNNADRIRIDRKSRQLWAESGAIVYPVVIDAAVSAGLSGLEHYVGIPSTIGGAMWQNLHFLSPPPERERTMFVEEVVLEAEILTAEGDRRVVDREYFQFGYDYSILHEQPDTVLSVTFQLHEAPEDRMREIIEANLAWRAERHPPLDTEPSAGSIFKKIEGIGAGRLIDWAGLKGTRIGGALVTHRHANIMINAGGATAADVRHLIAYVQKTVEREENYRLAPEIGFVGEFGDLPGMPPAGWEDEDGFRGGLPPGGHTEKHRAAERR